MMVVAPFAVIKAAPQESNCPLCSAHKSLFPLFKSGIHKLPPVPQFPNAGGAFLITVQRLTLNAGWRLFEHIQRLAAAVSLN